MRNPDHAGTVRFTPQQSRALEVQAVKISDYRQSIRRFIKETWGLVPQPPKPEYAARFEEACRKSGAGWEAAKREITGEWFGDPLIPDRPDLAWSWYDFRKGVHFTWQQNLILIGIEKAVAGDAKRLMSVVSGHGIGKSATCTWIILWFLYCYQGAQVPVTAPTTHQMHDVLWKELSIWINRMPEDMQSIYEWSSEYIRVAYDPQAWFARARTSTKENTEAIAGVHGDHVAIVVDEGSGVPQQVFDTAEGALTSGNVLVLIISNGTQVTGYFYDTQHRASGDWQTFSFNGEESPIVDRAFVALKAKHGFNSEEYRIRVKGGFPGEESLTEGGYIMLMPREKIGVRVMALDDLAFIGRRILGIDPSGEGKDEATFVIRDRFKAAVVATAQTTNDKELAEMALTLIDRYQLLPEDVVVGSFGVGADIGKEIAIATKDMKRPYNIYSVMEGNTPEKEERYNSDRFQRHANELTNPEGRPKEFVDMYMNIRALMYFRLREWLYGGGQIVDDSVDNGPFVNEIAVIRYKRALQGNRIQLMPKTDMKKLGIPSPNKADALALTTLRDMDDPNSEQSEEERKRLERDENAVEGDDRFSSV